VEEVSFQAHLVSHTLENAVIDNSNHLLDSLGSLGYVGDVLGEV